MKRATLVQKTPRGEQEPFARKHAQALKENLRLREDCDARIEAVERKVRVEVEAARAERNDARASFESHQELHADFSSVAPILRSRSLCRQLWWALRFAAWGVFRFEEKA